MLVGSLVFVALGLWFVIDPPEIHESFLSKKIVIRVAGIAVLLFFGLCAFFLARKLLDNKPGLIIDDVGITDNSSGIAAGQILWSDMIDLSMVTIQRQPFIMVMVKNPQDYIKKQTSSFKRKLMSANYGLYGTPVSISANGLKTSFNELVRIVTEQFNASRVYLDNDELG